MCRLSRSILHTLMLAALSCAVLTATEQSASAAIPASQNDLVVHCPQGTTAAFIDGRLECSLSYVCPPGYQAFPVSTGLICFKRENGIAAADCNDCHPGGHVQVAQSGRDTCRGVLGGPSEPNKLKCCNGATRWTDKDGTLDVCGFFAEPEED